MTAVKTTEERWCEAEVNRIVGENHPQISRGGNDKAEAYFERALTVACHRQAKSWELRAAMSMARLFTAGLRRASTRLNLQEARRCSTHWHCETFGWRLLNPSNTPGAKEESLPNTLSLFDAVSFWLVPISWPRVRFAT
jgi:hypothetical protein